MVELEFYTMIACHLCEDAEKILMQAKGVKAYRMTTVEISVDERLLDLYGKLVPVVKNLETQQELFWPFGVLDVMQLLGE